MSPEHQLCLQVSGRACTTPSPRALGAVAALARVAPAADMSMLAETVAMLAQTQPVPGWHTGAGWTPAAAWRAVDVYDSERVLLIDYDGPHPHTLLAQLCQVGGLMMDGLVVLEPGVATGWDELCEPTDVPMPMRQAPVTDVLGDLAHALRVTDMTWPRNDDEDFLDTRALAWSRCRDHLPDWPDHAELPELQRRQLIQDFATDSGRDDQVSRSLAELLLDYGEGYIGAGPLCWSPGEVMVLLTDWLPRKAILDADQRAALPVVLRRWLHFALSQRDISPGGSARSSTRSTPTYPSSRTPSTTKPPGAPPNKSPPPSPREASTSPTPTPSTTPSTNSTPNNSPTNYCHKPATPQRTRSTGLDDSSLTGRLKPTTTG